MVDGETLTEEPLDQLCPLGPRHPLETVEQPRSLDSFNIDVVAHRRNVYLWS